MSIFYLYAIEKFELKEFMEYVNKTHPTINMEAAIVDFSHSTFVFQNSNGVEFTTKEGIY